MSNKNKNNQKNQKDSGLDKNKKENNVQDKNAPVVNNTEKDPVANAKPADSAPKPEVKAGPKVVVQFKEKPKTNLKEEIPPKDPTVLEPKVEVVDVNTQTEGAKFTVNDVSQLKWNEMSRMDANHQAILLQGASQFFASRDPKSAITQYANEMLEFNFVYHLARIAAQNWEEGKQLGLNVPKDRADFYISTFNTMMGLALQPAKQQPTDPNQTTLEFVEEKSDKEQVEILKRENVAPKRADIETDPDKWDSDAKAQAGIIHEMTSMNRKGGESLSIGIMKTKQYLLRIAKENLAKLEEAATKDNTAIESAKKEVEQIESYNAGDLYLAMVDILGNKKSAVINGLCSGVNSSLAADSCTIFSHCNIRMAIPVFSDKDVSDLIKGFVKSKNADTNVPLDSCLAVKNGFLAPTRETFMMIPIHAEAPNTDKSRKEYAFDRKQYDKFMTLFGKAVVTEVGEVKTDEKRREYWCNIANRMISIHNLYLDPAAQILPLTVADYSEYPVKPENNPAPVDKPTETENAEVVDETKK